MDTPIRPELIEQVEVIKTAEDDVLVTLRGLYRLYFDTKLAVEPPVTTDEKAYLLGYGFGFSSENVSYADDRAIFDEESKRYYDARQTRESA